MDFIYFSLVKLDMYSMDNIQFTTSQYTYGLVFINKLKIHYWKKMRHKQNKLTIYWFLDNQLCHFY